MSNLRNVRLDPRERLDFVAGVPEQGSIESGVITPTLKLERNVLEQHYAPYFERWASAKKLMVGHDN